MAVALFVGVSLTSGALAGCGYTEQEWLVQTDKYQRVVAKQRASDEKLDQLSNDIDAEKAHTAELEDRLKGLGVDLEAKDSAITSMSMTLADREKALAEYKLRTKQLEAVKTRFEALRARLEELTDLGIEVRIRRNRMVISLPSDVLFDTGKDKLKKEGKDILRKVAAVIHDDALLEARDYQVAGNTDSKPLQGGNFGDNWGLSVMRARQVLLFMVDPADGKLPATHWSAAGYADTDPIATNDTDEGRQRNRRCDLVVLPSLDEMLDLRALAAQEGSARPKGEASGPRFNAPPEKPRLELETQPVPKSPKPSDAPKEAAPTGPTKPAPKPESPKPAPKKAEPTPKKVEPTPKKAEPAAPKPATDKAPAKPKK